MTLTFKSSRPEVWKISSVDRNGRERVATATRHDGDFNWQLKLQHPSGTTWQGTYRGTHIIDALGKMVNDQDSDYAAERSRGYKPAPGTRDVNVRVNEQGDNMTAPIRQIPRRG